MKTLLSIGLGVLMAAQPLMAQTNNVTPPFNTGTNQTDAIWLPCALILVAAGTAAVIIIYAMSTTCSQCKDKRLVLEEKDCGTGVWSPVATNDVDGICTNLMEVFRQYPTDACKTYRVKIYDKPSVGHLTP